MILVQVITLISTQLVSCATAFYATRFFTRLHGADEIKALKKENAEIKERLDKLEKNKKGDNYALSNMLGGH